MYMYIAVAQFSSTCNDVVACVHTFRIPGEKTHFQDFPSLYFVVIGFKGYCKYITNEFSMPVLIP